MTHAAASASSFDFPVPTILGANTPGERPYRGGEGIARFRGVMVPDEWRPEDFVGSTTEVFSGQGVGLSHLPDGELLRDAIERDPVGWLGDDHVRRWGSDTRLLVKLLDTRERLFVHFHPDAEFSKRQLHRDSGKTEAWIIASVDGEGEVWLGFNRDVTRSDVVEWFESQNTPAMLASMNRITVKPGDALYVPASVPHAIGSGITLVELQQPTDLSLILEWQGFNGLDHESALLGLGINRALGALDQDALSPDRLESLRSVRRGNNVEWPFPEAADEFFRAEVFDLAGPVLLDASFAILVILSGFGSLSAADLSFELAGGMTVIVPFAAGEIVLDGSLKVIRARPPKA